jgi:hypothetical protein
MSVQLTVNVPDVVCQRAQRLAELSGQDIADVLAQTLGLSLPPLRSELDMRPVASLPDDEGLALSESMMAEPYSSRMSALLYKQQNESVTETEHAELRLLMDLYEVGLLRKAEALAEAVKRGLRQRQDA